MIHSVPNFQSTGVRLRGPRLVTGNHGVASEARRCDESGAKPRKGHSMSREVANVLWEMLANAGVNRCYGIDGDTLKPVIDALRRNGKIEFIQVRHERVLEHVSKLASTDATVLISGGTQVPRPSPCGKLRNRLLQRVLDRMKADLATDLDLSTLAAESGYSRSHFLRTFRAAMGCSPHQWLTRLRGERAKTMLRENSMSLIDIALDCGFSSHAHFSNTFRQIVGVTPSEYRRTHSPIMKKRFLFASSSFGHSLFSEGAVPRSK